MQQEFEQLQRQMRLRYEVMALKSDLLWGRLFLPEVKPDISDKYYIREEDDGKILL